MTSAFTFVCPVVDRTTLVKPTAIQGRYLKCRIAIISCSVPSSNGLVDHCPALNLWFNSAKLPHLVTVLQAQS